MGDELDISAIEKVANDFVAAYRQQVIGSGHFASGRLNDSLSTKVWLHDDSVTVTIDGEAYAKYLNNGTRPHFPPVDKILEWIRVKPVLPRPMGNGKLPTERQLAFLIARKISEDGTPATHILEDTLKDFDFVNKLKQTIQNELGKQIERVVAQSFWRSPYDKA